MNYCIVAFAIVLIISVIQWYVDGRRNYKGPSIELVGEDGSSDNFADGLHFGAPGPSGNGPVGELAGKDKIGEVDGAAPRAELGFNGTVVPELQGREKTD